MMKMNKFLELGYATTEEALNLFDSLEPIEIDFMLGQWRGDGFHTNHPMDGLLETFHWYGKRFESPEDVHPLLFSNARGNLVSANPFLMGSAMHLPLPRASWLGRLFQAALPLFSTSRSKARLRMTTYRGKSSATMIYDQLPINDVFRMIDHNSVLGIMDLKGLTTPFFFILRRENKNL